MPKMRAERKNILMLKKNRTGICNVLESACVHIGEHVDKNRTMKC